MINIACGLGGTWTNNGMNLVLNRTYSTAQTIISQFQSGTGTNAAATTDTVLQTAVGSKKNFETGYPTFDTTNRRATVRGLLTTIDVNGNTITETGQFNTDSPAKLASRNVFTGISKTASVEIAFNWITSLDPS